MGEQADGRGTPGDPRTWGSIGDSVVVLVTRYPSDSPQSVTTAPPMARREGEFTRNSGDEPRHRTVCPVDLLDLTISRSKVVEPRQAGAGMGWTSQLRHPPVPHWVSFCVLKKKLWELCMC